MGGVVMGDPGVAGPFTAAAWSFGTDAGSAWEHWARRVAAIPFDALRAQYASAVRTGVMPASALDAGRFERGMAQWEQLLLGPWARGR
jgi:hypothetical protein